MRLHSTAVDEPTLWAMRMADIAHKPVHRYADRDANEHAPDEPGHAADQKQNRGNGNLMQQPCALQKAMEGVVTDARTRIKTGCVIELKFAMQGPKRILQHALAVSQIRMAIRLSLCPVAQIMRPHHPERTLHADERAEPHEQSLDPFFAFERAMNQPPMKAHLMPRAHCDFKEHDENRKRAPSEIHRREHDCGN